MMFQYDCNYWKGTADRESEAGHLLLILSQEEYWHRYVGEEAGHLVHIITGRILVQIYIYIGEELQNT